MEEVDFLFGPNPGEPQKALRLIASSGELARVMLALKSALARQDDTPLLIFDEIDANVGGEIARAVGMKMRELGRDHQVIAITHFPQVAALADHHYLISKGQTAEGRTVSRLEEVDADARIAELVRMLGTSGPTAEAHAKGLLIH
jgi:DNA repair protein RecN (Recombination protein N)